MRSGTDVSQLKRAIDEAIVLVRKPPTFQKPFISYLSIPLYIVCRLSWEWATRSFMV
jgi:hypothetical protein